MDKVGSVIFILVIFSVIATGSTIVYSIKTGQIQNYVDNSAQWCDAEGGYLWNAQSIVHGGLHCETPDGTIVHMWMIKDLDWTHNWEMIRDTPKATHGNLPWYTLWGFIPLWFSAVLLSVLAGGIAIRGIQRLRDPNK